MQSHIQPVTQQFRVGNAGLMAASRNASRDAVLEQVSRSRPRPCRDRRYRHSPCPAIRFARSSS